MMPRLTLLAALAITGAVAPAAEPAPAPAAPATPAASSAPATPAPAPSRRSRSEPSTKAPARAEAPATQTGSFETFRLIADRNIFNSNRTGRRERSSEEPAPRLDQISLVGTMESDRGLRAFFDGSSSAFRKALRDGESIDAFKVTQVSPSGVELERDGKTLSLRVGQQLRRPEGGEWNLISADVVRSEAAAAAAKASSGRIDPTAPVVIPANADEVTRRLMEKRNKDLKQ
ncbi:MAG: hypothetical protein Q8N18_01345 [Opitutaceae bacterium]|nr:hypothetical protein [Opitutaceae bacterium]